MDKFTSECTVVLGKGKVVGVKTQDHDDANQLTSYDIRVSRTPGGYSEVSEGSSEVILHSLNGIPGKGKAVSEFKRGSAYSRTSEIPTSGGRSITTSRSTFQAKKETKTFSTFSNKRSSFEQKSPLSITNSSSTVNNTRFGERTRTNRSSENLVRKSSSEALANETNESMESPRSPIRRIPSKTGSVSTTRSTSTSSKIDYSVKPGLQKQPSSGSSKIVTSRTDTAVKTDNEISDTRSRSPHQTRNGRKSPNRIVLSERTNSSSPLSSKRNPPNVPPKPPTPKERISTEDINYVTSTSPAEEHSKETRKSARTLSSSILSKTTKFEKNSEPVKSPPREITPRRSSNLNISAMIEVTESNIGAEQHVSSIRRSPSDAEDGFRNRIITQSSVMEKMAKFEKAAIESASPESSRPQRENLTLLLNSNVTSSIRGSSDHFPSEVHEEVITPTKSLPLCNKPWKRTDSCGSVSAKTAKFERVATLKSPTEEDAPNSIGRSEGYARRVKRTESTTNVLAKTAKFEKAAADSVSDTNFKKQSNPNLAMSPTSTNFTNEIAFTTTTVQKTNEQPRTPTETLDDIDLTPWRRRSKEHKMETVENVEVQTRLERRRSRNSENSGEGSPRRRRAEPVESPEEPKPDSSPWRSRRAETFAAGSRRSLSRSEAFDDGIEIKPVEEQYTWRSRRSDSNRSSYSRANTAEANEIETRTEVEEPLRIRRHINYGHDHDQDCLPSSHKHTSHTSHVEATVTLESKPIVSSTEFTVSGEGQDEFGMEALNSHNIYRRKHRTPRLRYSEELTKMAKEWAAHLVEDGLSETQGLKNIGQNVFTKWSTSRTLDVSGSTVSDQWYSEGSSYRYGQEPTAIKGNFTQMIWFSTEEFGIAKLKSSTGRIVIVANYRPAGNIIGQYNDNVLPPK